MKPLFLLSFAALALSACAISGGEVGSNEAAIPYVSSNGIVDWRPAGPDALYIRAITGDWYHVRTMGNCNRLRTATSLGFVTSGLDQLDRHGSILAEGQRCPLLSVVKSAPPPEEAKG